MVTIIHCFIERKVTIICCLVIILLAISTCGVLANFNPFSVVPKNHWSYAALDRLSGLGLVSRPIEVNSPLGWQLTRVEMAIEINNLLNEMAKKAVSVSGITDISSLFWDIAALADAYNQAVPIEGRLSEEEILLIKELVDYFQTDLEVLGYRFSEQMIVEGPIQLDALARTLGRFSLSGEGSLSYTDNNLNPFDYILQPPILTQKYTLHVGYWDDNFNLVATVLGSLGKSSDSDQGQDPVLKIEAINIGLDGGVVARVGDLSDSWWDNFVIEPVELEGVQAGYKLGQLGSTIVLARDKSIEKKDEYMAALDSTVYLDRLTIGATLIKAFSSADGGTIASVQGSYKLTPGVVLAAGLAGSTIGSRDAGALRLEGIMQLNDYITLSAGYQLQGSGFQKAMAAHPEVGHSGIDLSFSMGETTLSAAIQRSPKDELDENGFTTTSLFEIKYPLNEMTTLSASRQETKVKALDEEFARSSTTAVGINFLLPTLNMTFRLGATLQEEWAREQGASPAAFTSDVGLEYEISGGTVSLGYKVEIPGMEQIENEVTAQVLIRF
jgi:hypothetical protein